MATALLFINTTAVVADKDERAMAVNKSGGGTHFEDIFISMQMCSTNE